MANDSLSGRIGNQLTRPSGYASAAFAGGGAFMAAMDEVHEVSSFSSASGIGGAFIFGGIVDGFDQYVVKGKDFGDSLAHAVGVGACDAAFSTVGGIIAGVASAEIGGVAAPVGQLVGGAIGGMVCPAIVDWK